MSHPKQLIDKKELTKLAKYSPQHIARLAASMPSTRAALVVTKSIRKLFQPNWRVWSPADEAAW